MTKCFRLGFPLAYANALLYKAGYSSLNSRVFDTTKPKFEIKDFDFPSPEVNKTQFIKELRFATKHITKFVANKKRIEDGHSQKIADYQKRIENFEPEIFNLNNDIAVLKNTKDHYETHLERNKGKLKRTQIELRKKERTLGGIYRKIQMLKESIELHEKAIKELYVTFYPSLEYLGYENDFYKEICLDDIKSLHETFINIFLKYDLDAQFII